MRSDYEKQLRRGVLEMVVLSIVCQKSNYGYQISKTLAENSDGVFTIKEGTLYPILYRLEDEGLIRSRWGEQIRLEPSTTRHSEKPKKMYSATAKGHVALLEMQNVWQSFSQATEKLLIGEQPEIIM